MNRIVALTRIALLSLGLAAVACLPAAAQVAAVEPVPAHANARVAAVQVHVAPTRADWTYRTGEPVRFFVRVTADSIPLQDVPISYELGPEQFVRERGEAVVPAEGLLIDGGPMAEPGFLRLTVRATVDGRSYRGIATAGIEPENIAATQTEPADFDAFWQAGKDRLADTPMDVQMELIPERSRGTVNTYHVSARVPGLSRRGDHTRVYGMLCVPKAEGKYPALLRVPGAGVRPYSGDPAYAEDGIITLQIGIHGLPVNLDTEVYNQLALGALRGYQFFDLDSKDAYYFNRVYLSCLRGNDLLTSLPQWDGENLGVMGGSQGGQLAIVTAALDPRVTALSSTYPAYSDVTGYLHGRAGGWPHMFRKEADGTDSRHVTEDRIATTGYYDTVNFARRLKAPSIFTWGYNDPVCPPTSLYAMYNTVTAPKQLMLALETGHHVRPEQSEALDKWMKAQLKGGQK